MIPDHKNVENFAWPTTKNFFDNNRISVDCKITPKKIISSTAEHIF